MEERIVKCDKCGKQIEKLGYTLRLTVSSRRNDEISGTYLKINGKTANLDYCAECGNTIVEASRRVV
jgi:ribosomal protein L37AE/L43A